jgi:hypothetical protein
MEDTAIGVVETATAGAMAAATPDPECVRRPPGYATKRKAVRPPRTNTAAKIPAERVRDRPGGLSVCTIARFET